MMMMKTIIDFSLPNCLRLGGAPLDSAIYQSIGVVNKFIQKQSTKNEYNLFNRWFRSHYG